MAELAMLPASNQVAAVPADDRPTLLRDKWNENADEWITWVRDPDQPDSYWRFHRKQFLSLVPPAGRLTLDIGCGEGRVGRDLQQDGHRILWIDWSVTMCKAATSHREAPTRAIAADAARLPLSDASVDCAIAFMSLHDIDNMPGAIAEIARVLQDGKQLALAIVHPMYSNGRFAAPGTPDCDFVITRSYFKPELCVSQGGQNGTKVTFFREHRPLQAYIRALIAAGFSIEQLNEVTDEDQDNPRHRIPMFLDILATRGRREKKAPAHPPSHWHG